MEGINKKYNIEIEVLTPLSIGAGQEKDWVRGVDFVVDKGTLYKLNLKKMVANGVDVDDLTSYFATKDEEGLKRKLAGKLESVSDFTIPFPASTDNDVKTFVKNQLTGKPILTGSSLKGAVRSVLFDHFRENERRPEDVFGLIRDGSDFMRFIRIGDFEFDGTELVNTKIYNLHLQDRQWDGGWKHSSSRTNHDFRPDGFNTLYECLLPQSKAQGWIMLANMLFEQYPGHQPYIEKKRELLSDNEHDSLENLFYEINNHTLDYLEKEEQFFKEFDQGEYSERILKSIDVLWRQTNACNEYCKSCVLKMSAGSGFHSITGDWQYEDYTNTGYWVGGRNDGKMKYKSRKVAIWKNRFSLLGFVKLTIV